MDNGRVRRVSSPTFVGRAEQLAGFDEALARAAGGEPSLLLVAGESGVGKSRLVAEFATRARAAGARVLSGECFELGEGELPYAPIVSALRELSRETGPEGLVELAGPSSGELGRLLPEGGDAQPSPGDEEFAQARLFEFLLTLFGRLGQEPAARARNRGPPLGRPLDSGLPLLSLPRHPRRAPRGGGHLPLGRTAPPPPAAPLPGRDGAPRSSGAHRPETLLATRADGSAHGHPGHARPTRPPSTTSSSARKAMPSSSRSSWRRRRAGRAAPFRTRCATRSWCASKRWHPRPRTC